MISPIWWLGGVPLQLTFGPFFLLDFLTLENSCAEIFDLNLIFSVYFLF